MIRLWEVMLRLNPAHQSTYNQIVVHQCKWPVPPHVCTIIMTCIPQWTGWRQVVPNIMYDNTDWSYPRFSSWSWCRLSSRPPCRWKLVVLLPWGLTLHLAETAAWTGTKILLLMHVCALWPSMLAIPRLCFQPQSHMPTTVSDTTACIPMTLVMAGHIIEREGTGGRLGHVKRKKY